MPTVYSRGTTVVSATVSAGTNWTTTANAIDGTPPANPATYATWTNVTSGAVATMELGGFAALTVPTDALTVTVQGRIRHLVNTVARFTSVTYQMFDGTTAIGSPAAGTLTTAAHDNTATWTVTRAQWESGNLRMKVIVTRAATTTTGTFSLDHADIVIDYTMPVLKLETLVDDFASTVDKAAKWSASSAQVVWDASGQAKVPSTTGYYALATSSAGSYDLTGSSFYAKMTLPAVTGTRETFMEIIRGGVANDKMSIYVSGTDLWARRTIGGVQSGQFTLGAYSPTTHAWWRMRESGGTTYFDTSPDGTNWTNFWSVANGFAVTLVWVNISAGWYTTGPDSNLYVDNVNTTGVAGPVAHPLSGTAAAVSGTSGTIGTGVGNPRIETLTDNFAGDLSKWPGSYGGVAAVNSQAQIPVTTGYPALSTDPIPYDLAGSSVYAKVTLPPTSVAGTRECYMEFIAAGNNKVSMFWTNGTLRATSTAGGIVTGLLATAHNTTDHAWWKIHSTGTGDVRFSTSPDGLVWTEQATGAVGFPLGAMVLQFTAGYYGTETASDFLVDSVNVPPGTAQSYPLSGTVAVVSGSSGAIGMVVGAQTYPLSGTVAATSATTGTLRATLGLAGTAAALSATTGDPTAVHPLSGTTAVVSATSGTISVVGGAQSYSLSGTVAASTATTGTILARYALTGVTTAVTTTAGNLLARHPLAGVASVVSATSGYITITPIPGTGGQLKVYLGGSWVKKPAKVYMGGQWIVKPMKRWDGTQWKTFT